MEKHWLIVYDIRDTKRLAKISKCVESYGWSRKISLIYSSWELDGMCQSLENGYIEWLENPKMSIFFSIATSTISSGVFFPSQKVECV